MFCGEFTWLSDLSSAIVICAAMVFPIKRPAISLLNTNKQQSWLSIVKVHNLITLVAGIIIYTSLLSIFYLLTIRGKCILNYNIILGQGLCLTNGYQSPNSYDLYVLYPIVSNNTDIHNDL